MKTYRTMFTALDDVMEDKQLQNSLVSWQCDFEMAVITAMNKVHPSVYVKGCYFHFAQANWRHLMSNGLKMRYTEDAEFAVNCRMFTALAFLPEALIPRAFQLLTTQLEDEVYAPIKRYFEVTYVGYEDHSGRRVRQKEPLFHPKLWSVFDRVETGSPRSTNHLEGWHRRFSSVVQKAHPNFYEFLTYLKQEEAHTSMQIEQLVRGMEPRQATKKQKAIDDRLTTLHHRISADSQDAEIMEFLRGCAHNVTYVC